MKIIAKHTHIEISPYKAGHNMSFEYNYKLWDDIYHKYRYMTMDISGNKLLIPRGVPSYRIEKIFGNKMEFDKDCDEYDMMEDVIANTPPRNDEQNTAINFLTCKDKYEKNSKFSQRVLTMPPGMGKTYCGIISMVELKLKTIVICHRNKILDQWEASVMRFTNIEKDEILRLSTSKMVKILDGRMDMSKYKVIIASHSSLTSFVKRYEGDWGAVGDLFKKLRVGLKIIDEAHRNFRNLFLIDAYTNTHLTFYLTATLKRTDAKENRLYQDYFANIPKWGEHLVRSNRKHIIYICVEYDSHPDELTKLSMSGYNGYFDRYKFTDHQLETGYLRTGIVNLYRKVFANKDGRLLIMSSTKKASEAICEFMAEEFPDKKVGLYNSEVPIKEKRRVEEECDIISATSSSLGEGSDIYNLRYVFMTEPFASNVNAFQNPSRLRVLGEDVYSFYIEFIDEGFPAIKGWQKKRLKEFRKFFHSRRNVRLNDI